MARFSDGLLEQLKKNVSLVRLVEAGGVKLRLFTMISTFGTPQDVTADELRVGSFYPADDESETFLRSLTAQPVIPPASVP